LKVFDGVFTTELPAPIDLDRKNNVVTLSAIPSVWFIYREEAGGLEITTDNLTFSRSMAEIRLLATSDQSYR
jgi:hypothetical protein